ncbi:MAG: hypothetical protein QOF84_4865 [Streptomyces sp.]|nr:hypothetical protein [Streptomyces sp.]
MTAEDLASLLLRRRQTVYVSVGAVGDLPSEPGVVVLEAELADRGHLLTVLLRKALAGLRPDGLAEAGKRLLADVDALMGTDRSLAPLFRRFPDVVPYEEARSRYTSTVLGFLAAQPHQPCMACGLPAADGTVRAVRFCGHLVCEGCRSGAEWGCCEECCQWYACPVCERRYEAGDPGEPARPWLEPVRDQARRKAASGDVLRVLRLGADLAEDAAAELSGLLARRTPLPPQDHDDLFLLLAHADAARAGDWLPADIPLRESKALALGTLLRDPEGAPVVRPLLTRYLGTATDVLRLLVVWSGGDPDLLTPPRLRSLPRPLRRELLGVLNGLPFPYLTEDLARRPGAWKRVGEVLHPFEPAHTRRFPRAALAFAALRGSGVTERLLTEAARHEDHVRLVGDRLRLTTWAGQVEAAFAAHDAARAAVLLRARPGELLRRLDQLLTATGASALDDVVVAALGEALPHVGPGPLLGALGRLRVRTEPGRRRVFFPRGSIAKAYAVPDDRLPLPVRTARRAAELLEAEAVRRLAALPIEPYGTAVLDADLADLPVPFAERASAVSLVAVPRGSVLPMPPDGETVRLFLHWMQPPKVRVDLDLSVAMYDDQWRFVGLCDYTTLEYGGGAALHSGDLVAAPAPDGATEYVDLNLPRLAKAGVRHVVPVVLSYNDVPFDELPDAFAGFMAVAEDDTVAGSVSRTRRRQAAAAAQYDPRTVRQRFDLAGAAKICVPMVVDLEARKALWTDVTLGTTGTHHNVWRYRNAIARIGRDLTDAFVTDAFVAAGRATLWDLACWTAAARTDGEVLVRGRAAGELWAYRREADEPAADFAIRVRDGWRPDAVRAAPELASALDGRRAFVALVHADLPDVPPTATGTAYRLFPGPSDAAAFTRVTAGDLVAQLAPGLTAGSPPGSGRSG